MIDLIRNKIQEIEKICADHYLKSLYIFGSAVTDKFNTESDIDFLYKIDTEKFIGWEDGEFDYFDNLISLENQLQNTLNRKIDLVPDTIISNVYLKRSIDKNKQLVYGN